MPRPEHEIKARCAWANSDPIYIEYHDREWGVPEHDDAKLFEFLVLEGAQAGLSWLTILKRRANYSRAFDQFNATRIAKYGGRKVNSLLTDKGIIRNRLKIVAAIQNAKAYLAVQKEFESFDAYLWQFVDGKPIRNAWKSLREVPAKTVESEAMSKDLIGRGFKFVGPTICYAHMQATGMVNDHLIGCFRYHEIG